MNMHSYGLVADACPQGSALRGLMETRGLHSVYQPIPMSAMATIWPVKR
jgi:hypothetical protein